MDDRHTYDDHHALYAEEETESLTEREQEEAEKLGEHDEKCYLRHYPCFVKHTNEHGCGEWNTKEDEDSIKAMCQHND